MAQQVSYEAVHKQWSDQILLHQSGRFWRSEGGSTRGWSEENRNAGRWRSDQPGALTLDWTAWGPEYLQTNDGGRTYQCTKGYQFALSLPLSVGPVPQWLFGGQTAEQAQAEMQRLLRAELDRLRLLQRAELPAPRVVQLFRALTLRLLPFAKVLGQQKKLVPKLLKAAFKEVGWDVASNAALAGAPPPSVAQLEAFLQAALDGVIGKRRRDAAPAQAAAAGLEQPPELVGYQPFVAQQRADAAAAFGECATSVIGPEWCDKAEPSMGNVQWSARSVGPNGHGVLVPKEIEGQRCVLWDWVAHVVTELTYPDPRGVVRPELTQQGFHCWAASLLLDQHCRPRELREVRCLALTAASGNVYLISRAEGPTVYSELVGRDLTITRLDRPMHTDTGSAAEGAGSGSYQHLTLLCGTLVGGAPPDDWSTEPEGLVFYAEDIVAWKGRTMMRRPAPMRVATIEAELAPVWECEQADASLAVLVGKGGLTTLEHRPKSHREDWGFGTSGVTELIDDSGLEVYDGAAPQVHDHTKFQREFTVCFWIKVSRFEPESALGDEARTLFERGSAGIGSCPCVFLDAQLRIGVRANVDPGPECALRSQQSLVLDTWTHVAVSVQQSQRALELLINGEVDQRGTMSAHGKLFTDGEGLPLHVGRFSADAQTTCCISHLQVYPTCSLSRGSAKQVFQAQRLMLRELVEPERPSGVPAAIVGLDQSADLAQRVDVLCGCDSRAGWPAVEPDVVTAHSPDWCLPQHRVVLAHQLSEETQCVVELGAWLGTTTRFIRQHAPNAVVFAVDQWINEALVNDPEYDDEQVQRVLKGGPVCDIFLKNMWDQRTGGVVPLHLRAADALRWLHAAGVSPDLIYVDAARHYEPVFEDLSSCRRLFPTARLCGAAWDHPQVLRAVREAAWRYGDGVVHAEGQKGWVLGGLDSSPEALALTRSKFYENEGDDAEDMVPLFREVETAFGDGPDAETQMRHLLGRTGNCSSLPINFVAPPKGRTLLMAAALKGHVGIARLLIEEFNANVDAQTKQKGETALHLSAYRGQLSMVKLLLTCSASTALRNAYNETAAETAKEAGRNNEGAASCAEFIERWIAK